MHHVLLASESPGSTPHDSRAVYRVAGYECLHWHVAPASAAMPDPEGPSTQICRYSFPNTIPRMDFST